jgi:protein-S-isoprenylcysteine O-methyltransferase Ste14
MGTLIIIYIIGYFVSLWAMHTFKNELDINSYDPPHDDWYDDYDSNASAYVAISFMWPAFWFGIILKLLWNGLMFISNKFETAPKSETQLRIEKLEKYIKESPCQDPKDAYDIRAWKKEIEELKATQNGSN